MANQHDIADTIKAIQADVTTIVRGEVELAKAELVPQAKSVGIGVGSHGYRGGYVNIGVSSDYIMGRDPSQVFSNCVQRRSGQMPTRPLYEQPGWRAR